MQSANSPVFHNERYVIQLGFLAPFVSLFTEPSLPVWRSTGVCRLVIQLQSIKTEEQTQNKRTTWSGTLLLFPWIFESWPNHRATSPTKKEIRNIHQQAKNTWKANQHCPYIESKYDT